jgi:hypothetical protein
MQKVLTLVFCTLFLGVFSGKAIAYNYADSVNKKRLTLVLAGGGAAYAATMIGLSTAWYKDQTSDQGFHFFDDLPQWKQMDKFGHIYSAYLLTEAAYGTFRWSGLKDGKALKWAAVASGIMMTSVEVFDGFSEDYGFSWSDVAANTLGTGLFVGQKLAWGETRIQPKFSFQPTGYASQRPQILGNGLSEEFLKDYNGQTYWFSVNPSMFYPNSSLPKWLNFSLGYGARDMIYGRDMENMNAGFDPYRRYFLSVDVDLRYFKGKSTFLNTILDLANMIKIPAPALEFNRKQNLRLHPLYF